MECQDKSKNIRCGRVRIKCILKKIMNRDNNKQDSIKIVFAAVSLLLMVPPLVNGDENYHRTVFIFIINRVIDICFTSKKNEHIFFIIWSFVNQWLGIIVSALAFSLIAPDFAKICSPFVFVMNTAMFVCACSYILKDMASLIVQSAKEQFIKEKLHNEASQLEGEGL